MSTPCADLIDLLRLEKERIRKYRLLIFTDADVSDTLKNLDNLDIGGIPAECQIWDIERLFRVCLLYTSIWDTPKPCIFDKPQLQSEK